MTPGGITGGGRADTGPGPAEFPQQFLPPGFEHVDQCFLLFCLFDQGSAFCGTGSLVLALANTPPQIRGCLPEPRQVFLHDAELSLIAQPPTRWCPYAGLPLSRPGISAARSSRSRPSHIPHPGNTGRIRPPDLPGVGQDYRG